MCNIATRIKSLIDFGDLDLLFEVTAVLFNVIFCPKFCFHVLFLESNDLFFPKFIYCIINYDTIKSCLDCSDIDLIFKVTSL